MANKCAVCGREVEGMMSSEYQDILGMSDLHVFCRRPECALVGDLYISGNCGNDIDDIIAQLCVDQLNMRMR